jgi:hypothetical protein
MADNFSFEEASAPASKDSFSFEDVATKPEAAPKGKSSFSFEDVTSTAKAAGKSAAEAVLPTAGGLTAAGTAVAAATPLIARAGLAGGPWAAAGATAAVGITAGIGGSVALDKIQNLVKGFIPKQTLKEYGLDPETRAKETAASPYASFVGSMLPSLAAFRPGNVPRAERIVGAGVGGILEAGTQAVHGEFDPMKIALATAWQAGAPKPTALGAKVLGIKGAEKPQAEPSSTPSPDAQAQADLVRQEAIDKRMREVKLTTDHKLQQAAFMDSTTGEIIPQGRGHDDLLKSDVRLVQGFLTEDGTFVNRQDAALIAEAQHSDKLTKPIDPTEGLHSTDFGPDRMDALRPKSAVEELGVRTDSRKNFFEDINNAKRQLLDFEQKLDADKKAGTLSAEELFAREKTLREQQNLIDQSLKNAPEPLVADKQNLTWEETHEVLTGYDNLHDAIKNAVDKGYGSKSLQEVLKMLLKSGLVKTAKLELTRQNIFDTNEQGKSVRLLGEYYQADQPQSPHTVKMHNEGGFEDFVHEAVHAAAHKILEDGKSAAAKSLINLYEEFKGKVQSDTEATLRDVKQYGFTDVHEFLSEALSNREFQRLLDLYQYKGPTGKVMTLWQAVKEAIYDGLYGEGSGRMDAKTRSYLDEVLDRGAAVIEEPHTGMDVPASGKPLAARGPSYPVDKTFDPRQVKDDADARTKGAEIYRTQGEAAARAFFEGYERYRDTWLNPLKEAQDLIQMNINNKLDLQRAIENKSREISEKLTPEERVLVSEAIDRGDVSALTGEAKAAAEWYQSEMKRIGEQAQKDGLIKEVAENYITYIVDRTKTPRGALDEFLVQLFGEKPRAPGMETTSRFGIQARYRTFQEIQQALAGSNLELRTKDIAEIYKEYALSMEKAIENKALVDNLLTIRNVTGEAQVKRVTETEPAPYGWETLPHAQFSGYVAHPDLVPSLKFAFATKGNDIVNGLYAVSQAVKRMEVMGSFFHAKSLIESLSNAGIPIYTPLKELSLAAADKLAGTKFSGLTRAVEEFEKGGMGDSVSKWIKSDLVLEVPDDVSKGVLTSIGKFGDNMIAKYGPRTSILERSLSVTEKYTLGLFDKFTWDFLHTGSKIYVADKYLEKQRIQAAEAGKPFDEAAARKEIASFVNKAFGGLNWFAEAKSASNYFEKKLAMAAYSPEGRKGMQMVLFAPDWTISTIKAFTAALPKELNPLKWHPAEAIKGMRTPTTKEDYARLFQFKVALTYFTLLNGINMMTANRPIWENKDKTRIEFPDGTSMQAMKHAMEPYHWIGDPLNTLVNKLGFLPKSVIIATTGLEYPSPYAPKMVDPSMVNRAKAIAEQVLPFQVQAAKSAPTGEELSRAISGTMGFPIYGQTKEQKKEKNRERTKAMREQRAKYKEQERKAGRE